MRIEILVFPGVDELDVLGPFEVFRGAEEAGADIRTQLVSLDGDQHIKASYGLTFDVDGAVGSDGRADLLVIPGGGWVKRATHGAWAEFHRGLIPAAILDAHRSGTILASVCTGAMLIAAAGLLRNRSATTHHAAIEELRASGAEIVSARIVDDGDIITAGGVTSGIDLALYIVERFVGKDMADGIASNLEHERRGPIHVSSSARRSDETRIVS